MDNLSIFWKDAKKKLAATKILRQAPAEVSLAWIRMIFMLISERPWVSLV